MALHQKKVKLKVQRPSSSTISYTVTDAPDLATFPAKIFRVFKLLLRLVAAVCCITVLSLELHVLSACSWDISRITLLDPVIVTESLSKCVSVVQSGMGLQVGGWPAVVFCAALLWLLSRRDYIAESLLVIRGLGIQISTSSPSFLSTATTRFIPTTQIQDIFIHEAFIGMQVKFYLAIIVEAEEEAVVVFPKLLPRREILEEVWRGAKRTLYQPHLKPESPLSSAPASIPNFSRFVTLTLEDRDVIAPWPTFISPFEYPYGRIGLVHGLFLIRVAMQYDLLTVLASFDDCIKQRGGQDFVHFPLPPKSPYPPHSSWTAPDVLATVVWDETTGACDGNLGAPPNGFKLPDLSISFWGPLQNYVMPAATQECSIEEEEEVVSLLLLGDTGIGKSMFLSRLAHKDHVVQSSKPLPQLRDLNQPFVFQITSRKGLPDKRRVTYRLEFSDTASPESYMLLRPDMLVLCFAIDSRPSLESLHTTWKHTVEAHFNYDERMPVLMLGLKRDLRVSEDDKSILVPQEGIKVAQDMRCDRYAECSALTGELCKEAFEDIVGMAVATKGPDGGKTRGPDCVIL